MNTRHIFVLTLFILFLNIFLFQPIHGLGAGALLFGTVVFTALYFLPTSIRHNFPVVVGGLAVLLFAAGLVYRDNGTTGSILVLASLATILSVFYLLVNHLDGFRGLSEALLLPLRTAGRYMKSIVPGFKALGATQDKQVVKQRLDHLPVQSLLLGLIVSLPVILVLFMLLSGADPIFKHVVEQILSQDTIEKIVNHVFISVVIFAFLLPLVNITYKPFHSPVAFLRRRAYLTEYSVVMTFVAITLLLFVILQWKYIFMPSVTGVNLSQFGFDTYSAYVQKGFTEFIVTTGFVLSLLWLGLLVLRAVAHPRRTYLFGMQLLVISEFGVILASFFRRIWLYQYYHGMTLIRFYGGFLVIAIAFFTLTLLGRHLARKAWTSIELAGLLLIIAVFGFVNVEAYIAAHPPTVNDRVDYTYLSRMSADGYDGWKKAFDWDGQTYTSLFDESNYTADSVREHAYAGLVLQQLLRHYQTLVMRYGTPEEQKHYYQQVIDEALAQVQDRLDTTKGAENAFNATHPEGTFILNGQQVQKQSYIEAYNYNIGQLGGLIDELKQTRDELDKPRDQQTHHLTVQNLYLYDGNVTSLYSESALCANLLRCAQNQYSLSGNPESIPMTWYQVEAGPPAAPLDTLARTLSYNASEDQAYQRMKKEMPIEKLMELERWHFSTLDHLALRLSSDASSPQLNFNTDISLDTPFLPALR